MRVSRSALRPALALTLASALTLSACSDGAEVTDPDAGGDDAATATSDAGASETADAQGGTAADGAGQTAAGDDDGDTDGEQTAGTEPADGGPEHSGVVSVEESEQIASRVLTAALQSTKRDGEQARPYLQRAFAGPERRAWRVADELEPVQGEPPEVGRNLERKPLQPTVLAVSEDDGAYPQLILAQTVPRWADSDVPELHLLVRPTEGADFRVRWSAPMLPGTEVGLFERRSTGSPVLRTRTQAEEELARRPAGVLNELAEYVGHPPNEGEVAIRTNGYAPEVRRNAREQAASISASADFTQTDELLGESLHTLQLADGSAMSFAVMERTARFDVRGGHTLVPPDVVAALAGDDAFDSAATMTALVFVAVHVPAADEDRPASVIAAREQVVDASGS